MSSPAELERIEREAIEMLSRAAEVALARRDKLAVEYKGHGVSNPVTQVDREIQQLFAESIRTQFPDHGMLGEEGGGFGHDADYQWVVDPIDGTINYLKGLPLYGISVGVLYRRVPVVGAIWLGTGELLHARRGGMAHVRDQPLHPREVPGSGLLGVRHPGFRTTPKVNRAGLRIMDTRSTGSIAYDLAAVALGWMDFALLRAPKIWDVAGGVVILEAAGGRALWYDRRRGKWLPLDGFLVLRGQRLESWSRPLLAGRRDVLEQMARCVIPAYPPALLTSLRAGIRAARQAYRRCRTAL